MLKKGLMILAIVLMAMVGLAVTLTVIGPWAGPEQEAFMPVLKAFEEETGIEVEYKVYRAEDLANLLPAQFAARRAPGDVIFMWASFIREYGKKGHIMDVSSVIDPDWYLAGALDPVQVGNRLYGAAYTAKVKPGFWYRKSLFKKYGLKPPKTWDEFLALLRTLRAVGFKTPIASGDGVGWPLSDVTEHFLITFGSPGLQKDLIEKKISWQSNTVRYAMEKLVSLLKEGYFSEPTEWTTILQQWWRGDYALYFMGSWITGMVDDPSDLGVFSLPGAKGMVFGADYAFIPKYTKHPEEAKKLLAFLVSEKGQSLQVAQGGHIATNKYVKLSAYPPVDAEVAKLMEGVELLPDLDDSIGGAFQMAFWDQLKLLWVRPERLDTVLKVLDEKSK